MLAFRAAGFIATSTSGSSPGVKTSRLEKLIWKPDTPAREPAGARISAGIVRERGQIVAREGRRLGEL
jgi:hypothetical protein